MSRRIAFRLRPEAASISSVSRPQASIAGGKGARNAGRISWTNCVLGLLKSFLFMLLAESKGTILQSKGTNCKVMIYDYLRDSSGVSSGTEWEK